MDQPRDELDAYLSHYPHPAKRYGGAIGVRGGHGSGKTHLAMWLGQRAEHITTINTQVLYAKADAPSLFAVYRQLVEQLPRFRIQEVIHQALLRVAEASTKRAVETEEPAQRIKSPGDLPVLYAENNLDPEQLFAELIERLRETHPPPLTARPA